MLKRTVMSTLLAASTILLLSGCTMTAPQPVAHTFDIYIDGSGEGNVSLGNDGNISMSTVELPYSNTITTKGIHILSVTVVSHNDDAFGCKITDRTTGKVVAESSSAGAYSIATCGYTTGR